MMKPRNNRPIGEQAGNRTKTETLNTNGPPGAAQQTSAQAIRKRRSSINVYDQPSSLNARLRQLETDMLRLDEDRTKLFDDTHSSLAQFEIRLNEIQSILKSRQDNVEKYVEEMKLLLAAKEEFENQSKLLNEKHERIQDKFMHRETTISREIKLLKQKFELLEKNRQFRSILQSKSNQTNKSGDNNSITDAIDGSSVVEATPGGTSRSVRNSVSGIGAGLSARGSSVGGGGGVFGDSSNYRAESQDLIGRRGAGVFGRLISSIFGPITRLLGRMLNPNRGVSGMGRKINRVSNMEEPTTKPNNEPIPKMVEESIGEKDLSSKEQPETATNSERGTNVVEIK